MSKHLTVNKELTLDNMLMEIYACDEEDMKEFLMTELDNIALIVAHENDKLEEYKRAKKEFEARIKMLEKKKEAFDSAVIDAMNDVQAKTIDFMSNHRLTVRNNPESVEVLDESLIPDRYKKEKITVSVDKRMIKKEYQETGVLPTGVAIKRTQSLTIKKKEEENEQ